MSLIFSRGSKPQAHILNFLQYKTRKSWILVTIVSIQQKQRDRDSQSV